MKRLLAKIFDYTLVFTLLYLTGNELDIIQPELLIKAVLIATPILSVIIDTLLLKRFGKTPGKALLGLCLAHKPSFKKAFTLALLPLSKSFIPKSKGLSRCLISLILITTFASTPILLERLQSRTSAPTVQVEGYENWSALSGDLFTAYFPAEPEALESTIPLPEDYEDLNIIEHKATQDDIAYSVAYATVPKDFLKYSHSMILKHSCKGMANEMEDTTIVSRGYSQQGSHKAVDYVFNSKGKILTGRLLIIKDRMYRLELTSEPNVDVTDQFDRFTSAFIPN